MGAKQKVRGTPPRRLDAEALTHADRTHHVRPAGFPGRCRGHRLVPGAAGAGRREPGRAADGPFRAGHDRRRQRDVQDRRGDPGRSRQRGGQGSRRAGHPGGHARDAAVPVHLWQGCRDAVRRRPRPGALGHAGPARRHPVQDRTVHVRAGGGAQPVAVRGAAQRPPDQAGQDLRGRGGRCAQRDEVGPRHRRLRAAQRGEPGDRQGVRDDGLRREPRHRDQGSGGGGAPERHPRRQRADGAGPAGHPGQGGRRGREHAARPEAVRGRRAVPGPIRRRAGTRPEGAGRHPLEHRQEPPVLGGRGTDHVDPRHGLPHVGQRPEELSAAGKAVAGAAEPPRGAGHRRHHPGHGDATCRAGEAAFPVRAGRGRVPGCVQRTARPDRAGAGIRPPARARDAGGPEADRPSADHARGAGQDRREH